jgi:hypothetical protein
MKIIKTILALGPIITISLASMAQQVAPTKVPAAIKTSFAKAYPGVKAVKWEKESGTYEASFKHAQEDLSAVFAVNGEQLESEISMKPSELPTAVQAYVKTKHKGAAIKEAAKITKSTGEINYEAEVNGKDLLFDHTGKYIKVSKD